jgi:hypothetical protein
MQAHGLVGDHLTTCPSRAEAERLRAAAVPPQAQG